MFNRIATVLAITLAAGAANAAAPSAPQDSRLTPPPCERPGDKSDCAPAFDKMMPKPITRAQALARAAELFDRADTDDDGVLTPEEMREARPRWKHAEEGAHRPDRERRERAEQGAQLEKSNR